MNMGNTEYLQRVTVTQYSETTPRPCSNKRTYLFCTARRTKLKYDANDSVYEDTMLMCLHKSGKWRRCLEVACDRQAREFDVLPLDKQFVAAQKCIRAGLDATSIFFSISQIEFFILRLQ